VCRGIRTLRPPFTPDVSRADIEAAAPQYVREVSGFRRPAAHDAAVSGEAVVAVTAATHTLLDQLHVRGVTWA
jgi:hypothetical protein